MSMEASTQVESCKAAIEMRWVRTFRTENSSLLLCRDLYYRIDAKVSVHRLDFYFLVYPSEGSRRCNIIVAVLAGKCHQRQRQTGQMSETGWLISFNNLIIILTVALRVGNSSELRPPRPGMWGR